MSEARSETGNKMKSNISWVSKSPRIYSWHWKAPLKALSCQEVEVPEQSQAGSTSDFFKSVRSSSTFYAKLSTSLREGLIYVFNGNGLLRDLSSFLLYQAQRAETAEVMQNWKPKCSLTLVGGHNMISSFPATGINLTKRLEGGNFRHQASHLADQEQNEKIMGLSTNHHS